MTHDSTWLARPRLKRRMRLGAPLGLLLACTLLGVFASIASATPYDMRGEWSLEFKSSHQSPLGETGLITQFNEATGEFSGAFLATNGLKTTVEGTLSGTAITMTTNSPAPFGVITFKSTGVTLEPATNSLAGTGEYLINGQEIEPGEVTATRLKTMKEVEEKEAQEQREQEEKIARTRIRGEWELTIQISGQTFKAISLISEEANSKNEFASSSLLFEGAIPGSFTGTLEGGKASVKVTSEAEGSYPATEFTSNAMTVTATANSMSMTGSGTGTFGSGTLTATRLRSHQQIEEQRKQQEKEAKEKLEKEEQATAEQKAREQKAHEQAAREQNERELKERQAREAAEKAAAGPGVTSKAPLLSVALSASGLTVGTANTFSVSLTNPNASPVQGQLKLVTLATSGKSSAKHHAKSITLGTADFTIVSHGSAVVKVKLSPTGRAQLTHHKTLHATLTLTTQVAGQPSVTKTYSVTLHAAKPGHGKH